MDFPQADFPLVQADNGAVDIGVYYGLTIKAGS